ncbi:helix-turn-helix domain-containing protein [Alicyclobacillus mengziensis]|uniref:ArsR family transcriptional regulator n=1 Tax=Alicyclobacillus mengziensis TaxID=2931921 RepID=A0A9X7VZ76_9BACL|nr:ArsR family transcriptional regulator [Alicyclobacillus mengziensis]QSO47280.1 ArsR family transcriptional regulator [Alicyclobacillus mengziensis]
MAKIRLGVLGADDSLSVIEQVAKEFAEFSVIPVVYWEESEIPDRIKPYLSEVDAWLCSGQVPYSISQELQLERPIFYTRHSSEGLYQVLLYLSHERGLHISDLSFDTLSPDTMNGLLADLGTDAKLYLKHYTGVIDSEELVQFHQSLWEQGCTKVAVTCLRSAQLKLQQIGIPAMHITPTKSEVRQVLETIPKTCHLLASREAQVAVQLIHRSVKGADVPEQVFDAAIHRYARHLQGTKQQVHTNRWAVYTTRGAIDEITTHFTMRPPFATVTALADDVVCGGMGVGATVREAFDRARLALEQAQIYGPGNWAGALETNTILAPLGDVNGGLALEYGREDLQQLSGEVPLSALTLSKIASVLTKRKSTRITVNELAEYFNILPRSARRILLRLEEHGLATIVGEETTYQRGRPRKIYDICL